MTTTLPQPPRKRFYTRWWFWLVLILVILGGVAIAIGVTIKKNSNADRSEQETITVQRRDLNRTVSTTGKVIPEQTEHMAFSISGRTTVMNTKVGDVVNKDDVLIEIDGGSFAQRDDEKLTAPFDGRVLSIMTFVDDEVIPNTPILELGYRTNLIELVASESEVFDLQIGQTATITIPSYGDGETVYYGTVEAIEPVKTNALSGGSAQATSTETGFTVRIRPTDVPAEALQFIGLTVDVAVVVAEKDNVLSIERAAIQYDDNDQPFVYLPNTVVGQSTTSATDQFTEQDIELGFAGDEYVEITEGLDEDDTVVLYIPEANVTSPF